MSATSRALLMTHDTDPKEVIRNEVKDFIGDVTILATDILVGVYRRPEKSKGGILLSVDTRKEDNYQGKVGLVLQVGDLAFKDYPAECAKPKEGDWVVFNVGDTFAFHLGASLCRIVGDENVKFIIARPDVVL